MALFRIKNHSARQRRIGAIIALGMALAPVAARAADNPTTIHTEFTVTLDGNQVKRYVEPLAVGKNSGFGITASDHSHEELTLHPQADCLDAIYENDHINGGRPIHLTATPAKPAVVVTADGTLLTLKMSR
ncbi:MAG TPA: hypothetical protein VNT30_17135 [Stellaceae bacterium]|nr:hypothetical protein [Stellaceae bacterium]